METELLRKQRSNIMIQREIRYQQENPCLQESILEVSAKAKEQAEQLHEHEERLPEIQDKIRLYNMQITENETEDTKTSRRVKCQTGKVECRTRQHITERHPGWNH